MYTITMLLLQQTVLSSWWNGIVELSMILGPQIANQSFIIIPNESNFAYISSAVEPEVIKI